MTTTVMHNQKEMVNVVRMLVERDGDDRERDRQDRARDQGEGRPRRGVHHFNNIRVACSNREHDNVSTWLMNLRNVIAADEALQGEKWPAAAVYTHVATLLTGTAGTWFRNISSRIAEQDRTFDHLAMLMTTAFGSTMSIERKIKTVMTRTKNPTETYAQYADELRRIGILSR
jgi:hypothetical protein